MRRKSCFLLIILLSATSSIGAITSPAAKVPPPKAIAATHLPEPFAWPLAISSNSGVSLAFHIDLDLLAPLGTGSGNAATWFRDFTKPDGARLAEFIEAEKRLVTVKMLGGENRVLPPHDPLLREAEPWVDQATCRFYPGSFP